MRDRHNKRALVLSGGGSKGAYQVGAIEALLKSGQTWDAVYGISVGALNASWLAMTPIEKQKESFQGLRDIWDSVKSSKDIYEPWAPYYLNYVASLWKGSLNSGRPLRKLVERFFDIEKLRRSGVALTVGCLSFTTSRYHSFTQDNDQIKEYILASSHLPVIFEPLEIEGQLWLDGGIRHQIPILDAVRDGYTEIDVIVTQPVTNYEASSVPNAKLASAVNLSLRGASIFSDQIYFNDCMNVIKLTKDDSRKVRFFVPSVMPNEDSMNFDGDTIQRLIEMGHRETKEKIESELAFEEDTLLEEEHT